jgi:hypothetical protein
MTRRRYAPTRIGQSKLAEITSANRNVIDQTTINYMEGLQQGSKALCAAILKTGKLHSPMTMEQQLQAIEYAHDVTLKVIGRQG